MFIIALSRTYKTKITVELPNENGQFEKSTFNAVFKRMDFDELEALRKLPQREVLEKVLVGWTDMLDGEKIAVPFTEETFNIVIKIPQAFAALAQGFWASIYKAAEKN